MSIPEACIEAAKDTGLVFPTRDALAKDRARRVIRALAENMPEDAVEKALLSFYGTPLADFHQIGVGHTAAAIADFLKHVAGDTL